jgi:hypothetical protein
MSGSDKAKRVSISLQSLAITISDRLKKVAKEPVGWVLVCAVDYTAQYVSNVQRHEGKDMMKALIEKWEDNGTADIPAHYNPDLPNLDNILKTLEVAKRIADAGWKHGIVSIAERALIDATIADLKETGS